jgi:hypothetical protein
MKNRILSIFFVLTLAVSLQSCFEVDEPINIVKPSASIVFNDNALTDQASFSVATGNVSFKIKVSDVAGTITSVALANRYSISGNATVKVQNLPNVTLTGNTDSVCSNDAPITLSGGSPMGGDYTGAGVAGVTFTPANVVL